MIKAIFYKEWIKMRCFYPLSALFLFEPPLMRCCASNG